MAEIVAELQERLLPEYELLKKFEVCTDEQIRECIRKRESFHTKITQSEKSMRDYLDFIKFEKKMHKWVTEKEKLHGTKMAGLKASIATRIIRAYREGCAKFPHILSFWEYFIQFSKKSVPHEVSGIFEKVLDLHADDPNVWCNAALWAYEYSPNMAKVKEIFFRGLHRHPESEAINKSFFDILLMETSKMSAERNLANNTFSEQDKGLECVELIYRNSKKKISNVAYFLRLLERCEEDKFANLTVPLQKTILDDLMQMFPRQELLWDALAQRELRGFSMSDLANVRKIDTTSAATATATSVANELSALSTLAPATVNDSDDDVVNVKDPSIKSVWVKRTLKQRIELACSVYQKAVRMLQTVQMWTLYINAMLKLNQDMSTQQVLKRKQLAIAFKEGHESGLMSIDHYCAFVRMLLETPVGIQIAENVLSGAVQLHKSVRLYEVWLSTYVVDNNEQRVREIFRRANNELGAAVAFPLWRLALQFYKTRYDDCAKSLQKLYKEACQQVCPEFGVFRGEYLEFCILNMTMQKTRSEYDELCKLPPPCMELHQKMAILESQLAVHTKSDFDRWRLCHENAAYYFGKTQSKVWIDYIKFERDHGDPKRMSQLYQRAKETLDPKLVDNFISDYTLLTANI